MVENRVGDGYNVCEGDITLPEIQQRAIAYFGITKNPFSALYILSSGALLSLGEARSHADICGIYPRRTSTLTAILDFLNSGAIRFARCLNNRQETSYAQFSRIPTERQIHALKRATRDVPSFSIDFLEPEKGGPRCDSEGRVVSMRMEVPKANDIDKFLCWVRTTG